MLGEVFHVLADLILTTNQEEGTMITISLLHMVNGDRRHGESLMRVSAGEVESGRCVQS